ncbi:hypothetical protein BDQ17DRAFT_435593 [Cyathus striatus]|nr:hypothetical protein BDQ17DRAFT_435593 [Cyathus striatus]
MADIPVAPPPWKLKGRLWSFPLSSLSRTSSFPAGFSAPYEADALASGGEFIGGPGSIMIVSYTESPVGPYDELLYIPGRWKYRDGQEGFRITRIYVSTSASTMNGRRNWNIPKQVADFKFEPQENGVTNITVAHPGSSTPFFKASVNNVSVISRLSFPFNTAYLGKYFMFLQPRLPAGSNPEEVATEKWTVLTPTLRGRTHVVSITGMFEGGKVGDGEGFPAIQPWSLGIHLPHADLDFGHSAFYDTL